MKKVVIPPGNWTTALVNAITHSDSKTIIVVENESQKSLALSAAKRMNKRITLEVSNKDEMRPKALAAAESLKKELEPLILGKTYDGIEEFGEGIATEIIPGGSKGLWYQWCCKITPVQPSGRSYATCIALFVDKLQLKEMFERHFSDIDVPLTNEEWYE